MHHVMALIHCRVLCALFPRLDAKLPSSRGSHWKQPLYSYGRGRVVYILPPSDPIVALLSVGFTEYDDDMYFVHT
ncbi:hypothetical protein Hanom_Chr15g01379411 [Helianthus anomalus]